MVHHTPPHANYRLASEHHTTAHATTPAAPTPSHSHLVPECWNALLSPSRSMIDDTGPTHHAPSTGITSYYCQRRREANLPKPDEREMHAGCPAPLHPPQRAGALAPLQRVPRVARPRHRHQSARGVLLRRRGHVRPLLRRADDATLSTRAHWPHPGRGRRTVRGCPRDRHRRARPFAVNERRGKGPCRVPARLAPRSDSDGPAGPEP